MQQIERIRVSPSVCEIILARMGRIGIHEEQERRVSDRAGVSARALGARNGPRSLHTAECEVPIGTEAQPRFAITACRLFPNLPWNLRPSRSSLE